MSNDDLRVNGEHTAIPLPIDGKDFVRWERSNKKKTMGSTVILEFTSGPNKGRTIRWIAWWTENTYARNLEQLQTLGFAGHNLRNAHSIKLSAEVKVTLVKDSFTTDNGKVYESVKVNGIWPLSSGTPVASDDFADWAAEVEAAALARGAVIPHPRSSSGRDRPDSDATAEAYDSMDIPF